MKSQVPRVTPMACCNNCCPHYHNDGEDSWMKRVCTRSTIDVEKYGSCGGDSGGRIYQLIEYYTNQIITSYICISSPSDAFEITNYIQFTYYKCHCVVAYFRC